MPSETVTLHHWEDLAGQEVAPGISRQYLNASRVTIAKFALARGSVVPAHAHENEQVSYVVSGALQFHIGGRDILVRGGDVIQIPSRVEHGVTVLEDSEAIDVFSPVRQDWVDGTDTYFRK
jgi:quercetin dioxygenase-like cupin family protein